MLSTRDLRFAYPNGGFSLSVADFSAAEGETVGISGPSGAGKSTFLRLLSGIIRPDTGSVIISGENLAQLSAKAVRALRLRRLGLVFQDFALLDYLSVEDNILLPSRLGGTLDDQVRRQGRELADQLEIAQHWNRLCGEISQGERQRVAVARALAHSPVAVLADEPTASLDAKRSQVVMNLLTCYAKEKQAALIVVTHDNALSSQLDRVINVEEWTA
ncbi:MAG: ATP-binding cassette domain-containing protein [Verrucomicrobia bacterium]|nr:ATP-binding cassette domain-containing protein [Verrucomicrobiota bacterium]